MIKTDFDIWDFLRVEQSNKYENYEAIYNLSFDELTSISRVANRGIHEDENGKLVTVALDRRKMIINIPKKNAGNKNEKKYPVVIFFHGLGDHPWDMALYITNWRLLSNKYQFIVAFGWGTDCDSMIDHRCGFNIKNPDKDFQYLENMVKFLIKEHDADLEKFYFVGFSNGGIFSSLVAQKYGCQLFRAIVNIMGGFGKDSGEVKPVEINYPLPILVITSTNDDYRTSCEKAHKYFLSRGCNSKILIISDFGHNYPINEEENIWNFLLACGD